MTNRCKQYWLSKWSKDKGCNTQKHHFTRSYLNIKQEEVVEFEVVKKSKSSFISISNAKQTKGNLSTIDTEHPLIAPHSTIKKCSDQWKDMPPRRHARCDC